MQTFRKLLVSLWLWVLWASLTMLLNTTFKTEKDISLYSQTKHNCYSWSTNQNLTCHHPRRICFWPISHVVFNFLPNLFDYFTCKNHNEHLPKSPSRLSTSLTNFLKYSLRQPLFDIFLIDFFLISLNYFSCSLLRFSGFHTLVKNSWLTKCPPKGQFRLIICSTDRFEPFLF